ncbi:MAG: protein kinase [Candidatus Aminicenantes bacterium]|nr:protein kinase [Candidatus Aminicenantes bacterium]NIM82525.1 protein kinase [Candidatus Aminicenantes bacterium]NIN21883.1 protein kinase [Candidatus Aminicenantes bacterium]NIN45661.1 protein kinase [Candidatus Aminicenantes bacterium]NIN88494.1 protein kinase [Candidatus Aminicenantes bacterium]
MKDDNDDILKAVFNRMGDSYEYIKYLGTGATSRVYLVYQKHLKQYRALKIMDNEYIHLLMDKENDTDSTVELNERRKRFINEANAYMKIKHPNVAEIYDIRQVETKRGREIIDIPYIIMEYVEGVPLSHLLKSQKPLKLETAASISVDILDALDAIHQKDIIHRDIKPSNIMIEKGTDKATIIDFGLAKDILEATPMTSAGMAMGTFIYMSPEQFEDSSKVGPGTDIYSFGVILYEMLTGEPPYMGSPKELMHNHIYGEIPDIREVDKDLPGVMNTLIRKAMAKKEKKRGNAPYYKEILKDFIRKSRHESVETVISSVPVFKSRNIKRVAYAAVFIFMVMISFFLYFYLDQKSGRIVNDRAEISTGGLKLPDPGYYGLHRDELRKCSKTQISTLPTTPWVAACAREGTIIYQDASLTVDGFQAAYLQRFEVLDKTDDKLKLKELDKPYPRTGWAAMRNLIYLPRALRDERTFVYQKVVFTTIEEQPEPGETGNITFYKSPGSNNGKNILEKRWMGNLRIAYVYAWEKENNDDKDFHWVLIGDSPTIKSVSQDETAFIKIVYGWCKTTRLFSWNSRMGLVPNQEKNARAYIFRSEEGLINFYGKAGANSVPDTADLLTPDSYKMWKDSNWPFYLERKFYRRIQDHISLVYQVDARQAIMKSGYAVEKDPRFGAFNQFKEVYLFRRSEIDKINQDLETVLVQELLKPRNKDTLCKVLVEWIYVGEKYDPRRTFNDYAQMNDDITYKELAILFDKTQEQIDKLDSSEFDEIEKKIRVVRARLEDIINDQAGERFFGPSDDPYIWLYEEELP